LNSNVTRYGGTSLQHSGWKFFVRIPIGEKALLFASPLSESSLALAERASLVVVVGKKLENDPSAEEWGKQYCLRKELLNRIQLCTVCGTEEMPFRERTFSVIAIDSMEEAIRSYGGGRSRWMVPEKLVVDLFKYLRPGGEIFISMKKPSVKSVLRCDQFGLLPQWIVWRLRKQNIQVETTMDFYPSLGNVIIVRVNKNNQYRKKNVRYMLKALLKSESFGIVCKKPHEGESRIFIKEVLNNAKGKKNSLDPDLYKVIRGSGGTFVLDTGLFIIRIPRLWYPDIVCQRWLRNFQTLEALGRLRLPFKTPQPIHVGHVEGQPYSVESKILGYNMDGVAINGKKLKKLSTQVIESLISLFHVTSKTTTLDEKEFKRLFGDPIDRLSLYSNMYSKRKLEDIKEKYRSIFLNTEFPLILNHGDFKRSNFIFARDDRLYGICDWDLSLSSGLPLLDLYTFLGYEIGINLNLDLQTAIITEFINKSPCDNVLITHYLEKTYPIDEMKTKLLALLTIIYDFAFHSMGFFVDSKTKQDVEAFLSRADEFLRSQQ